MTSRLAKRRYRLGLRMYLAAARGLRYWLLAGVLVALAISVATAGAVAFGVWAIAVTIAQWFVGVAAGIWLYTLLPLHVANGVTRGEFIIAFAVFGALVTVSVAATATLGFLAEHALIELVAEPLPFNSWGFALAAGTRYLVVTPVYFFAGSAVSALAMRMGARVATTAVVIVLVALIYIGTVVIEFFEISINLGELTFVAWAGGALALIASLVAIYSLSLRSVPIRAKKA